MRPTAAAAVSAIPDSCYRFIIYSIRERAIRFCVLASGSKGNAIWVEADGAAILVDSGLSGRELQRRMDLAGLSHRKLTAILISHEHRDHIAGVGVAARRFKKPVYMNEQTGNRCRAHLGKIDAKLFKTGHDFELGPITIHPFSVS
ncbi:MAG: MBL fold metallo-hydrolase, partial [Deltaproteobacteria bacterium]|nr:MBL fold metallo-hydrolase [Deltaproteobacteria bacterium]